jgi:hypothetical protein
VAKKGAKMKEEMKKKNVGNSGRAQQPGLCEPRAAKRGNRARVQTEGVSASSTPEDEKQKKRGTHEINAKRRATTRPTQRITVRRSSFPL